MKTKIRDQFDGRRIRSRLMPTLLAGAVASTLATSAHAQEEPIDEVIVTGARATIQSQIELKRNSIEVVDGLNADEIGELPALSIGEALETITAAASHRENGGATEVSIRGMGPFLGTTVVNGREATNGGGNRAVNFSIFPSEMFNKIAIHKTQSASYIEGAVSGQIHLDTRRPIEYGDQRVQLSLKASGHPDDGDIKGQSSNGYRATASYINSWETEAGGAFGLSIGVQKRDDSNPEQEATHSTGGGRFEGCLLESFDANALPVDQSGRCHDGSAGVTNDDIQGIIDSDPNVDSVDDIPWAYIPRSRQFRQNSTDDEREAIFGALQWQPNDAVDILLDFQASERDQKELRRDLLFGATQNNITRLRSNPSTGLIGRVTTETDIASMTDNFSRFEEYDGAGLNIAWQATDTLGVAFDVAYSDTKRTETDVQIRMGANEVLVTDPDDIGSREDFLIDFNTWATADGLALPTVLCTDTDFPDCDPASLGTFDITDPRYFSGRDRARIRARQQIREMEIDAYRLDFTWDTEALGPIHTVLFGVRDASLEYRTFGGNRNDDGFSLFEDEDFDGVPGGTSNTAEARTVVFNAANNCGLSSFPQSSFLSRSRDGNNLVTVANGIGSGNAWATFDHGCLLDELLVNYGGRDAFGFQNGIQTNSVDMTEDTLAFYVQANYESEIGGRRVRGNFGVRVVETDITAIGYRTPLSVVEGTDSLGNPEFFIIEAPSSDGFETTRQTNSYTEVLPSVTFVMDLDDDLVFRAGAFRGISRFDPHAHSNARNVSTNDDTTQDTGFASLEDAVRGITADGNPQLEPLPSLNLDLGLEWYANDDTLIAGGLYWKEFQGGFENVFQRENFVIDGNDVAGFVRTTQVSDDKSTLTGFELTATHSFNYLPGFWGGFGMKLSYNFADSDFEFEDGFGGDATAFDADGNPIQLIGIVPPAGLNGLSRHVSSAQLYWQNDRFNISVFHKYRDRYLQLYTRDADGRLRYTNTNQQLELRMNYDITDNITASFEALNLLSEPRVDYRPIIYNVAQTLEYGPRMFLGVRAKF